MSDSFPKIEHLVRQIRNLTIASTNFDIAGRLAKYIYENEVHEDVELYHGMFSGVAVAYCRNFNRSNETGNYNRDKKLTTFDDQVLQKTHDTLMEGRNVLYAHEYAVEANELEVYSTNGLAAFEVEAEIKEDRVSYRSSLTANNPEFCRAVRMLCEHQKSTICEKLSKLTQDIVPDYSVYRLGDVLKLGDTFPRIIEEG